MKTILLIAAFLSATIAANTAEGAWVSGPRTESVSLSIADGGKLYLDALVNGRKVRLAVDTGAGTTLDMALAEALGIPTEHFTDGAFSLAGTAMDMRRGVVKLELGEMTVSGVSVFFLDMKLARKQHTEMGLVEVDGVLGGDVLSQFHALIDYDKKRLTIRRPKNG